MKNTLILSALLASSFAAGAAEQSVPDLRGIFPPEVKCVWVVAPSSQASRGTVEKATNALTRAGYRVKVSEGVWNYAAEGSKRARYLEEAWKDPETDLILCARGGRGGFDTVTNLNFSVLRSRAIPFVGFSNISCLMNAFVAMGVGHPVSGPMCTSIIGYPTSRDALTRLGMTLARKPLEPTQLKVLRPAAGSVTGRPAGGHWPSISRMESPYLPSTAGRVVFLEVNKTYDLASAEAAFETLKGKGFFRESAAVVICDLGIRGTNAEKAELEKFLVGSVTCPVFSGYPYGHVKMLFAIDYERPCSISPGGLLTWAD